MLLQVLQFTHGVPPRASSWTQAGASANREVSCDTACGGWKLFLARMQMMRTPVQYLRANAAIIAANPHGSDLVPCAGFNGRQNSRSPGSKDAGNGQEFCSYDGSMSNGNSNNADSYRLCCCVDENAIPPEDASTGCPFTSSDCDTSDWMALNPTNGLCIAHTQTTCPAGHWADASTSKCVACVVGKYALYEGAASEAVCVVCPATTYGVEEAQTSEATGCHACVAGKTSNAGATQCSGGRTGWIAGDPGMDCMRVCAAGAGGSCREPPMQEITTQLKFEAALFAVTNVRGSSAGLTCSSFSSTNDLTVSPARYDSNQCNFKGRASECGSMDVNFNKERLCCCVDGASVTTAVAQAKCATSAADCTAGYFWNSADGLCETCPSGTYTTTAGTSIADCTDPDDAVECNMGAYGIRGSTGKNLCMNPPKGRYSPSSGLDLSGLSLCPRGKVASPTANWYASEALACSEECPVAKWAPSAGLESITQCVDCSPGRGSATGGLISNVQCTQTCGPGRFNPPGVSLADLNGCTKCSAGKYSNRTGIDSDVQCTGLCPGGRYGPYGGQTNASKCVKCPSGKWSTSWGLSTAIQCSGECSTGRHADGQSGLTSEAQCVDCEAGTYSPNTGNSDMTQCSGKCDLGKFSNVAGLTGQNQCKSCSTFGPNYVAGVGKTGCTECTLPWVPNTDKGSCVSAPSHNCAAGMYNIDGATCLECSEGRRGQSVYGPSTMCSDCGLGKYASTRKQTECTACGGNTVTGIIYNASACSECPTGKVRDSAGIFCSSCVAGKYRDTSALTWTLEDACKFCAVGTASAALVDTTCEACIEGQFTSSTGLTSCSDCQQGEYLPLKDITTATACKACGVGNVSTSIKATACIGCGKGAVPDLNSAACDTCATGTYKFKTASKCSECPPSGVTCAGGVLTLEKKAWYPPSTAVITSTTEMHTCFNDESCETYDENSRVRCNIGKGYFGPLCGGCDRDNEQGVGFFTRSGLGCAKCWSDSLSWLAFLAIGLGVVFAMTYLDVHHTFAAPKGEYGATVQKILMSHLQMLGVLGIFKARGTQVFNDVINRPAEIVGGSFTSLMPIKCALKSQVYGPFLLNMSLPFILLFIAAVIMIPKYLYEKCARKRRIDNDDPVPTFKGKFNLPRVLAPFSFLRLPMTPADVKAWKAKSFSVQGRFAGVAVFTMFTLYPTLVSSIASIWNCTGMIDGSRYLVADLTVVCYESRHNLFIFLASVGALFYALGIPAGVAFATALKTPVVCRTSVQLDEDAGAAEAAAPDGGGETTGGDASATRSRPRPRSIVTGTTGIAENEGEHEEARSPKSGAAREEEEEEEGAAPDFDLGVSIAGEIESETTMRWMMPRCRCKRRSAAEYASVKMRSRFAFLYNGYSTERSGAVVAWEAFVMLRKLAVSMAGSTVSDPYLQILSAQMILLISALATAYVQPYETPWLNLLDTLGLFALITTQILSILYFYTESASSSFMDTDALEIVVTTLLFALNLVIAAVFACTLAMEMLGMRESCEMRGKLRLKIVDISDKAGRRRYIREITAPSSPRGSRGRGRDRSGSTLSGRFDRWEEESSAADLPPVLWRHPKDIAVRRAPTKTRDHTGATVWLYSEPMIAVSRDAPELLVQHGGGPGKNVIADLIRPGNCYRWLDPKTGKLSKSLVELPDVGGGLECCGRSKGGNKHSDGGDDEEDGIELGLDLSFAGPDGSGAPEPIMSPIQTLEHCIDLAIEEATAGMSTMMEAAPRIPRPLSTFDRMERTSMTNPMPSPFSRSSSVTESASESPNRLFRQHRSGSSSGGGGWGGGDQPEVRPSRPHLGV